MKRLVLGTMLAAGLYGQTLPPPSINSISPSVVVAGSGNFTLSVIGANFRDTIPSAAGSRVLWNGAVLPTNYIGPGNLQAQVVASQVATAGTVQISVAGPNGTSNALPLTILTAPTVTSISPTQTTAGAADFPLTVNGTGFTAGNVPTVVMFGSDALTTSFVSATELRATVGSSLVKTSGTVLVQVAKLGQVFSNFVPFIVNPAPTISPASLPNGAVNAPYSQQLGAKGGTGSYTWSSTSLPAGLALNKSGLLSGNPTTAGAASFTVTVTDSVGVTGQMQYTLTFLGITTLSPLAAATVGTPYSQTFAATGGVLPYTWSLGTGTLPAGLKLSPQGLLDGTPTQSGTVSFTLRVVDRSEISTTKPFIVSVNPGGLSITTASLPGGTAGAAYAQQQLAATGGTPPYTWSAVGLPAGLALSQAGVLSGTPGAAGTFTVTVTVNGTASKQFTLVVTLPTPPAPSIGEVPASPGQQPSVSVLIGSQYSLDIIGTMTLTFTPDSGLPDDPMIVFPNGTRTLDFTIKAASTAVSGAVQIGTVAGRIDLTITRLSAAGQSILPTPAPLRSIQIARAAPSITSVQVVRTSGGFDVQVRGFSTPRQVTQAVFNFTAGAGKNLQTLQVPVQVDSSFTTWYGNTTSNQFGSTFLYTQPFTVNGDISAIASVSVTLTNAVGTSQPASASF